MATPRKDAKEQVSAYIQNLPIWSQKICNRLRNIILSANSSIVKDCKWEPNYNSNGMVCGHGARRRKVIFFEGHRPTKEISSC
jgi:hypothetical protein